MLHREPDNRGLIDWRQIAGLNQHGDYHTDIPRDVCHTIATETREFEIACLQHDIAFLTCIQKYFSKNNLRHVQKIYDERMRAFKKGDEIPIMVFCNSRLEKHRICKNR
jgi:hypothetical protein